MLAVRDACVRINTVQWEIMSSVSKITFCAPLAAACQVIPGLYVGRCPGELEAATDVFMSLMCVVDQVCVEWALVAVCACSFCQ